MGQPVKKVNLFGPRHFWACDWRGHVSLLELVSWQKRFFWASASAKFLTWTSQSAIYFSKISLRWGLNMATLSHNFFLCGHQMWMKNLHELYVCISRQNSLQGHVRTLLKLPNYWVFSNPLKRVKWKEVGPRSTIRPPQFFPWNRNAFFHKKNRWDLQPEKTNMTGLENQTHEWRYIYISYQNGDFPLPC